MHLRRALILFAVVLGIAALVASLTGPTPESDQGEPATTSVLPELGPQPRARGPAELRFRAGGKRERRRLRAGRAAVVTVEVEEPGQVSVEGLGLTAAAEPLTPARFDVLTRRPGSYEVRFTPVSGESTVLGVLRVTQASR